MALDNPPYIAPYTNIFTDPETGVWLGTETWDGAGWKQDKYPEYSKARTIGNPDKGYEDV